MCLVLSEMNWLLPLWRREDKQVLMIVSVGTGMHESQNVPRVDL